MWRNFGCEEILFVKKFEVCKVRDNMIHTILLWHGWYLCCFVAKSVFSDLSTFYVEKN